MDFITFIVLTYFIIYIEFLCILVGKTIQDYEERKLLEKKLFMLHEKEIRVS